MTTSNKPRTFLATTALDEFWDKSQPILFLGEWCKSYDTQSVWENCDSETLQNPLIDQDPDEVCQYIYKIYKGLLPTIAKWLNGIHRTTHSLKYWEIVVGSFLFTHVQTVYDRYSRLKKAYALYPELTTIGLDDASFFVPLNTIEYYQLTTHDDAINLQIITQIIDFEFNHHISKKKYSWDAQKKQREESVKKAPYRFITHLKLYLLWFFVKLRGSKTVALMEGNFTKKDLHHLIFSSRLKILPLGPRNFASRKSNKMLQTCPDFSLRSNIAFLSASDPFSKLVLKLLVAHMPMSFIENHQKECMISKKRYPYFVKVVLGIPVTSSDEYLSLWMAKNHRRGARRGEIQHGGGNGALKSLSNEFWEHAHSDFYISWGMKNKNNVIAAPVVPICHSMELKKLHKKSSDKNGVILWVATEFTKYPCEVQHSVGQSGYEARYFNTQSKILSLLDQDIFSKITMRLRHTDWSDHWKYIRDAFPNLTLHKPTKKMTFHDHIWTARLLIFDNLNTTFLYGLSMNIPSILCWDEKIWPIQDEVKFYFDALRDAGIYHTTPESAANMINTVGDDPLVWWNTDKVQSALHYFCEYFAYAPENWLMKWKNILLRLL